MAFLGRSELNKLLAADSTVIEPFDEERLKEAAYELCLGNEVYLTDSATKTKEILDDKKSQVIIKPGQFALLLTQETINMPPDKIAFISIKFGQKIKGLINVSGFHVDPGFRGKIIFSVFNAGPTNIALDKGQPYFMIWFSKLESETEKYSGSHQGQNSISAELVGVLQGDLASPNSLLEKLKEVDRKFDAKIEELKGKKDYNKWVLQAIAAILFGLFIKSCTDNNALKEGYQYGLNKKSVQEEINSYPIDSIVAAKVDSILNVKRVQK